MKIVTPCAFCRTPIAVGFWNYLPSKPPTDIFCPRCGGRNNINLGSISLAIATLALFAFLGAWVAKTTQETVGGALIVGLVAVVAGAWPAAFLGSRRPDLIKYSRWRVRPTRPVTDGDRELMDQLGVVHNGEYFIVGDMHFDHLGEAVAYAREGHQAQPEPTRGGT